MNIKNKLKLLFILAIVFLSFTPKCLADDWYEGDSGYYTVLKEDGEVLFLIGSQVYKGDEYISGDNQRYKIAAPLSTGGRVALPRQISAPMILMPALRWDFPRGQALAVQQTEILLHCGPTGERFCPQTRRLEPGRRSVHDHCGSTAVAFSTRSRRRPLRKRSVQTGTRALGDVRQRRDRGKEPAARKFVLTGPTT